MMLINKYQKGGSLPIGNQQQYNNVVSIYQSLVSKGVPPQAALEIVNQKVAEKGWTGFATGDNKKYSTANGFADHIIDWHGRMYPDSLKARSFEDYWKGIQITPKYKYNSEDPNYKKKLLKTRPGVKKRINYYRQQQGLPLLAYINNIDNNIKVFKIVFLIIFLYINQVPQYCPRGARTESLLTYYITYQIIYLMRLLLLLRYTPQH